MNKAIRILTLYHMLLNGEEINKTKFAEKNGLDKKTIQRDIRDINYFLYDFCDETYNQSKVIYSRKFNTYSLVSDNFSRKSLAMLGILTTLKSITPILHIEVYNFFLKNIKNLDFQDQILLNKTLNYFNIKKESMPQKEILQFQKAINNKNSVYINKSHNKNIKITPLSIMYMHYDYWLTYSYRNVIYSEKISTLTYIESTNSYYNVDSIEESVKFEIDISIIDYIKKQFSIDCVSKISNNKVEVLINCTELDAYYIAYQLAPLAKIIEPSKYVHRFIKRLNDIKNIYK